jgi:hypothetical protein
VKYSDDLLLLVKGETVLQGMKKVKGKVTPKQAYVALRGPGG